jgi:hypothetical protein
MQARRTTRRVSKRDLELNVKGQMSTAKVATVSRANNLTYLIRASKQYRYSEVLAGI